MCGTEFDASGGRVLSGDEVVVVEISVSGAAVVEVDVVGTLVGGALVVGSGAAATVVTEEDGISGSGTDVLSAT